MIKRPALVAVFMAVLYMAVAVIFLLAMPGARGPFDYLVAGALATGVCLFAGFILYIKARMARGSSETGRWL
jgi:hypothetical protein